MSQYREQILDLARDAITNRKDSYGAPEDNFVLIADLWSLYLGFSIRARDVAVLMCLFKIARIKSGVGMDDNFVDICGYASLAGEME